MARHAPERHPEADCVGKLCFSSFGAAARAARRTNRAKGREGEHYQAYHCTHCGSFHVGTKLINRIHRRPRIEEEVEL